MICGKCYKIFLPRHLSYAPYLVALDYLIFNDAKWYIIFGRTTCLLCHQTMLTTPSPTFKALVYTATPARSRIFAFKSNTFIDSSSDSAVAKKLVYRII